MNTKPSYRDIMNQLELAGHKAYLVGGAVRNAYLNIEIKDYDVVTSATPAQVINVFPDASIIHAAFSVSVHVPSSEIGGVVEVATMREERDEDYINGKPERYSFTDDILVDLSRRDATINAIAMDNNGNIIDPYAGREHLDARKIVAIGDPVARITAHPIRMLRYARFATSLGSLFAIDAPLIQAIISNRMLIVRESWDAIGKEFIRGISSANATKYIITLRHLGLLEVILPEVYALHGVTQNIHHDHEDVWNHTLRCVQMADSLKYEALNKLAVLLHDIGKPSTRAFKSAVYGASFHGHELIGAEMASDIAKRFRLSEYNRTLLMLAIKLHMYKADTPRTARRFIGMVGGNNTDMDKAELKKRAAFVYTVKLADVKKGSDHDASSQKDEFELIVGEIDMESPFKVTDLEVSGHDIMEALGIDEGKEVGVALDLLLQKVIDEEVENNREALINEAKKSYGL